MNRNEARRHNAIVTAGLHLVLAAILLAAACDGRSPAEPDRPAWAKSLVGAPGCPDRSEAIEARHRTGGRVPADVDGDGTSGSVWLAVDPSAAAGCRALVVARAAETTWIAPIRDFDELAFETLGLPALSAVVPIDDRPGAEVVVDVTAGASTTLVGVFTLHEGALVQVALSGRGAPDNDLLPYGGSVTHVYAVDCSADGAVVVSEASPRGRRYVVRRWFYEPRGATWTAPRLESETVRPKHLGSMFPEFVSSPFLGCRP
ncbi:MAG: hypothetical protein ABR529_02150 [Actinomycetota bacterium]